MIIKLTALFLGIVMGFFCGMKGSTVGGTYCSGLTKTQEKYLQSKSWLFKLTEKLDWVTLIMCTPVGFIPAIIITVMLEILFPGWGVFNFFSTNDKYILGLVLLYIGPMWMTYFVGVFKGESLQTKYKVYDIKN